MNREQRMFLIHCIAQSFGGTPDQTHKAEYEMNKTFDELEEKEMREKVKVDDVIGLIKTEPTNSVEEVRKLRETFAIVEKEGLDIITNNGIELPQSTACDLLNTYAQTVRKLTEENERQEIALKQYRDKESRMHLKYKRLSKDWDRLCQHLIDMQLMTDDEIVKVIGYV